MCCFTSCCGFGVVVGRIGGWIGWMESGMRMDRTVDWGECCGWRGILTSLGMSEQIAQDGQDERGSGC